MNEDKKTNDLAQVPYIEHELRMHKAYKRENILKGLLVASNLIWATTVIVMLSEVKKYVEKGQR